MRVLMISVDAPPRIGGIATFTHCWATEMNRLCETAVLLGPYGTRHPDGFGGGYEVVEDLHSQSGVQEGQLYFSETRRIRNLIGEIVDRLRITHIILFHAFYYGSAAAEVASSANIPLWTFVHGTELTSQFSNATTAISEGDGSSDLPALPVKGRPFHLFSILRRSERVVANSHYTGSIAKRIVPEANVVISGCGLSEEFFRAAVSNLRRAPAEKKRERDGKLDRSALQMCFIGRLVPHKRVDRIISLVAARAGWELTVIGDGPCRCDLERQAAVLGVAGRVSFLGVLDDQQKWLKLALSDFLMLPSGYDPQSGGYEGFGIVLLEAIAAGVVPVGSATEGMQDPIHLYGLGIEGLNEIVSEEETASRMVELFEDDEKYGAKLARDTETISKELLWSNIINKVVIGADAT